jgi:hypothetical protein
MNSHEASGCPSNSISRGDTPAPGRHATRLARSAAESTTAAPGRIDVVS